ncbi:MAG TPA: pyridoxal-phosphate dependent enzyme, partial [Leptospiraceae bacterium]|nr:pyridoxal-phosphate dependent enzyme [Leptospiraceae bacterium]
QASQTLASAIQIGNPVSYPRARRALEKYNGIVEQATEQELADAAARADLHGLFNDPHTGVALAGLIKCRERGDIEADARVVVISTAHGLKFQEFKAGYHEGTLADVSGKYRNSVKKLRANVSDVQSALEEFLRVN